MKPLRYETMTETFFDRFGVKKTVQPNELQRHIMRQLEQVTGLEITQDRRVVAHVFGEKKSAGGAYVRAGFNSPFTKDGIVLNFDADTTTWWSVLFHELAHATMESSRLDRNNREPFRRGSGAYMVEEVLAETVSLRVMDFFGLHTEESRQSSLDYILRYQAEATYSFDDVSFDNAEARKNVEDATAMVMYWIGATDLMRDSVKAAA
jgi:hypothetical protein